MINIEFKLNNNKKYSEVIINGHAMFADLGNDIVCAGVSSIVFGTLNMLDLSKFSGKIDIIADDATISIKDIDQDDKIQTIIETMYVQILTMSSKYNKNINLIKD